MLTDSELKQKGKVLQNSAYKTIKYNMTLNSLATTKLMIDDDMIVQMFFNTVMLISDLWLLFIP